ncbi:MAG: hypothetical protein JWO67_2226 [Streptosporangiaceae bacterium]|nr:hypothetical protein [Streptosporangiaceae bacterium]
MNETPKFCEVRYEQTCAEDDDRLVITDQKTSVWTGTEWVDVRQLVQWWNEGEL